MSGPEDFERERQRLAAMAARARDLRPVLTVVAQDIAAFVDDRFETATDPAGQPWAETQRRQRDPSSKINIDSARLRQSCHAHVGVTEIVVGTNVEYAPYVQAQRPFLPVISEDERDMRGPSGEMWRAVDEAVRVYVETGRVT